MPRESRKSGSSRPDSADLLQFDTGEAGRWGRPAGIDEVGRGPLAGPLVACCVILPPGRDMPGVFDSKALSARTRETLSYMILEHCEGCGIGLVEPSEIDSLGMTRSVCLAFERAVSSCSPRAGIYLVDGLELKGLSFPARFFVKGDSRSLSIAAASIVAKVHRDRLMGQADQEWPGYGFASNSGYGSPAHLEALFRLGPCPIHRRSFRPLSQMDDLFGGR